MSLNTLQRKSITVSSSGLTTSTTAYVAGDMLGTELTLANAAAISGDGGFITGIQIVDKADILGAVDLRIFNAATTPAADNAANSWSDADAAKQVCGYQTQAAVDSALNRTISVGGLMHPFTCAATSLFLDVITLSAHTFFGAGTDLQFIVELLQWT